MELPASENGTKRNRAEFSAGEPVRPLNIVFILGSGHCGSTLLDMMLDNHPEIVGVGEMHAAKPSSLCACGNIGRECPFWRDALGPEPWPRREIYRSKFANIFGHGTYRSAVTRAPIDTDEFRHSTIEAYRRILARTGKTIIVDSSKSPERAALIAESPGVKATVIHLVRDGRPVTWSYVRKYKKLVPYLFTWALANLKIEASRRRTHYQYLYLRYEDLTEMPEACLRAVSERIGVSYVPSMLEFRSGEHHQIEGNRMRHGSTTAIKRDDAWKTEMPPYLRVLFSLLFGWLNALYVHRKSFS